MQHVIAAVSFCYVKSIFFSQYISLFYQIFSEKEYFRRENLKE